LPKRQTRPHNHAGRWQVRIADSAAAVQPGGRSEIRLDAPALAAIYSGYLSPLELAATGQVEGPREALAALQAAFTGPPPWMREQF